MVIKKWTSQKACLEVHTTVSKDFKAKKGADGAGKRKKGAKGKSILIEVPQGTSIYNDDKSIKLLEFKKNMVLLSTCSHSPLI